MNLIKCAFLLILTYSSVTNNVNGRNCLKTTPLSGEIYLSSENYINSVNKCWFIEVPKSSYVRIELKELNANGYSCSSVHVKLFVIGANETYTFCPQDTSRKPITALNDVNVTYYHASGGRGSSSFRLRFTAENLICAQKNHFRCSPNFCIHEYQVCNGIKDCADGADEVGCEKGIMAVKGMNISRINAVNWLKNQRTHSFGWGKNTHRAVIALYLSRAMIFQGDSLEEELIAKQLELQTSVALLRNASDKMSISELSMFVNALMVTCHNPRHFYGYDLVQILSDRLASAKSSVPSAYLTLCNMNWTLSHSHAKNLANILQKPSKYPFQLDIKALTVMALTCIRNKVGSFETASHIENLYQSTIQNFSGQLPDGSFGNIYTTALVTQALISSGQEQSKIWNATATAQYLMKQLNSSSIDILSVYLTLPIFSGRSLLDIKTVDCSNKTRKEGEDKEISEVTDKLGGKMQVQYSLYIGDRKDVVHTIYLRVPNNSSAYDIMRVAQVADPKYKFLHREVSNHMYIYEIAGIVNDPEAGNFWLLYTAANGYAYRHTESPDEFILQDNGHLVMWYKTVDI